MSFSGPHKILCHRFSPTVPELTRHKVCIYRVIFKYDNTLILAPYYYSYILLVLEKNCWIGVASGVLKTGGQKHNIIILKTCFRSLIVFISILTSSKIKNQNTCKIHKFNCGNRKNRKQNPLKTLNNNFTMKNSTNCGAKLKTSSISKNQSVYKYTEIS